MALLGLGPRVLLCVLSQLFFQPGAVPEIPLAMRAAKRAKRQRLLSIAGVGRISDTGLEAVLAAIRKEPELLDDNGNR